MQWLLSLEPGKVTIIILDAILHIIFGFGQIQKIYVSLQKILHTLYLFDSKVLIVTFDTRQNPGTYISVKD